MLGGNQPESYQDEYKEDRSHEYPVHFFVSGPSYKLLGICETSMHFFGVAEPGKVLLFGTDAYGRDALSRLLFGGQISVAAGITATFIVLLAGSILGIIAGYYGRWIDESLMGITELFLSAALALFPAWGACIFATTSEYDPHLLSFDGRDRPNRLGPPSPAGAGNGSQLAKPELRFGRHAGFGCILTSTSSGATFCPKRLACC